MSYPNQEQAAVLSHLDGTLLVLAPAGTGKTRLMADRLAAVIAKGMPPEKTLGVTFTNRAAEHIRSAVRESCGADAKDCRIQTFHGLCAWMLRIEARNLGLPADFVIKRVKADFGPVTDRHASTFAHRRTQTRPAPSLADGLPPEFRHAENSTAEADWIATRIESIPGTNHLGRIGILTRTHKRSEAVSRALTQRGIAHLTVEQFDFFRRQEIKDLLARLRLLLNPSDTLDIARRFLNLERHDLTTISRHILDKEPRHSCRVANGKRKNRAKLPTFRPPLARRTRVPTLRQTISRAFPGGNGGRKMNANSKPHLLHFSVVVFKISAFIPTLPHLNLTEMKESRRLTSEHDLASAATSKPRPENAKIFKCDT